MEGIAGILWELAYDLRSHEQVEQERRAGESVCSLANRGHHPDQCGGRVPRQYIGQGASRRNRGIKKTGKQAIGRSRGGLTTKIHMVTASDRSAVSFSLSSGARHDSPEGMKLLSFTPNCGHEQSLLMDRAYEGDNMRSAAKALGYNPVVPPKKNRVDPWEYDRELYRRRNEVERFFRRIKRFRRVFTRYDKLDILFAGFILFAMIIDVLV